MRKLVSTLLVLIMALSMAACGTTNTPATTTGATTPTVSETTAPETTTPEASVPETVTIQSLNGSGELVDVTIPYDPQRLVMLDLACLDYIDNLGLGDRVVGSASTSIDYLSSYVPGGDSGIVNCGTIKTPDLESVMECEPDVIFIGGRLSKYYDQLSEIAPVVYLPSSSHYAGVVEMTVENARLVASLFGKEAEIDSLTADFSARIDALKSVSEGKTAIVGMCTGGGFNVLGNDGRCSIIGKELGWENVGVDANINTDTHGNEASFEFILDKDPDYIFVLDRDKAVGTEGAQLARDIMENDLVMGTDCYQNGNLIILDNPNVWYTAEGGITALGVMLGDLETALGLN